MVLELGLQEPHLPLWVHVEAPEQVLPEELHLLKAKHLHVSQESLVESLELGLREVVVAGCLEPRSLLDVLELVEPLRLQLLETVSPAEPLRREGELPQEVQAVHAAVPVW